MYHWVSYFMQLKCFQQLRFDFNFFVLVWKLLPVKGAPPSWKQFIQVWKFQRSFLLPFQNLKLASSGELNFGLKLITFFLFIALHIGIITLRVVKLILLENGGISKFWLWPPIWVISVFFTCAEFTSVLSKLILLFKSKLLKFMQGDYCQSFERLALLTLMWTTESH